MAKGYWIVRVDITDQERYKLYMAANAGPFKKYGARFLVRSGRFENPEGTSLYAQCGARVSDLRRRSRMLEVSGVSSGNQATSASVHL